jgi:hypothetical protein
MDISLMDRELYELEYELIEPWFRVEYIYREYAAAKNVSKAKGSIKFKDMDIDAEIKRISLNKLIEGGVAMFIAIKINQNIEKVGLKIKIPLDKIILRVLNIS